MTAWQNWQAAFLKQAKSDWDAYQKATKLDWPDCQRLHYLQMTTEKLSKAFLVAGDTQLKNLTGSHAAFVKFIRIISGNKNLQIALGMKKSQQKAKFNALLPLAREIELLAPALAQGGPNPEYPWETQSGTILAPADHSFPLMQRLQKTPQGTQLLKYIEIFQKRFEELFM